MILECPSCHARYLVPIGLFAQGGRQVRCARCKNSWHATLPTTIDVFMPLPEVPPSFLSQAEPPPPLTDAENSQDPREKPIEADETSPTLPEPQLPVPVHKWAHMKVKAKAIAVKAIKIVFLIGLILIWPITDRVKIVKALPEMRGIYTFFHLYIGHSGSGLTFEQVKSELKYDSGIMRLSVDGNVHNTTDEIQFLPNIVARALGPDRHILQSWWVPLPTPTIAAQGVVPFHTEVNVMMNHTIEDVYLEFYSQDEKGAVAE